MLPRCEACAERCPASTSPLGSLRERHALQEILHVVHIDIALGLDHHRLGAAPLGMPFVVLAVDVQPPLGAGELLRRAA